MVQCHVHIPRQLAIGQPVNQQQVPVYRESHRELTPMFLFCYYINININSCTAHAQPECHYDADKRSTLQMVTVGTQAGHLEWQLAKHVHNKPHSMHSRAIIDDHGLPQHSYGGHLFRPFKTPQECGQCQNTQQLTTCSGQRKV